MFTARRINASRANGALFRSPKTEVGKARTHLNAVKTRVFTKSIILKNESPARLAKLRDEYYQTLQPTNAIERDLVEEMVNSKWLTYRVWGLESSSVNYKMDEQKEEVEAKHARLKEHSHSRYRPQRIYDNSSALPHIQRNQARYSRLPWRPKPSPSLRANAQMQNGQTNLVPKTDTASTARPENHVC